MTGTSFGRVELETDDYENFLLGGSKGGYVYPVRKERVYVAAELPEFFERAQAKLEELLSQVKSSSQGIVISDREQIMHEFHLLGHGKTGTNRQGKLTGWSGDMLCHTYREGEGTLGGIELAMAQAGIMPPDDASKRLIAKQGIKAVKIDDFYLRFVSDLPRAIEYALRLTGNQSVAIKLDEISGRISAEIERKGNFYDVNTYQELMKLALTNGFIPTPLLRAQYYGPMELRPEKLEPQDKNKFVEDVVREMRQNFINASKAGKEKDFDESAVRAETEEIAEALIHRKELLFAQRTNGGNYITEDRLALLERMAHFYNTVIKKVGSGRPVLVITSSGCFDVSNAYFRNFGRKDKIILENESKRRGRVLVAKLGNYDKTPCYLNDPKRIEAITLLSTKSTADQRNASLDDRISKTEEGAIIPFELLRFEKQQEPQGKQYMPKPISEKDMLANPEPTLLLGNFGQGKSIAAVDLAERLNASGEYVAIHITAREIDTSLHNMLRKDPKENDRSIMEVLSRGAVSQPQTLRGERRFVFIVDAYDEISHYGNNILHVARDPGFLREQGKVIVTSRFTPFHEYENPGFATLHLDPQAVIRNIDAYLTLRISDSEKRARFKDFLMQQDEAIKTNYLLVYFLTDIYNRRPQDLGDLKGIVSEGDVLINGIKVALWDHKLPKRLDLAQEPRPYEGQPEAELTDLMQRYEAIRGTKLEPWMNFLQIVGSYMTTHDQRTISRREIEQVVSSGWTLANYAADLSRR